MTHTLGVGRLIASKQLSAFFQPIVRLADGAVIGHEALLRGPAGTPFEQPHSLFSQAEREGLSIELEHVAAHLGITAYATAPRDLLLFVNYSAPAIRSLGSPDHDRLLSNLIDAVAHPLVIEVTERSEIGNLQQFGTVIEAMRGAGYKVALDDYGVENASMSLWVHLAPHFVKVDRFFIHGIAWDALKFEAVKSMVAFARASGSQLIAEGIEHHADLRIIRDLGISYGQGFLLGRPAARPALEISRDASSTLDSQQIAVYPGRAHSDIRANKVHSFLDSVLVDAPPLTVRSLNDDVVQLFNLHPALHALPVLDAGKPVGLINRRSFMDQYALPYHRELFGRRPCMQFANREPVVLERTASIDQVARLLTGDEQHMLSDGFIVIEQERYLGLVPGISVVRAVTELRLESARHANPLTFLPGNLPLGAHIDRLIASGATFVACYADLDHFKPFNDRYGYWQGDELLKMAATTLASACEPTRDFLGHIGGDDFLALFQSDDWEIRLHHAIQSFNLSVTDFYSAEDKIAGGIGGEDRSGRQAFFGFVRMSVGAIAVPSFAARSAAELSAAASAVKRLAKKDSIGFVKLDLVEALCDR
ncbi:phosphodiesterase [Paraburkholderia sp. BCC1886]|uniref:phosphodiesterase n=1 Tax=Paraburkholderia sp. BCC1886 TaxID=2562670 RepID=UPI00118408F0|nr:phosphodiesterase [Paraburkholderia sp. BCC1886]